MKEIDVKRTHTDILQCTSGPRLPAEGRGIVAEHQYDRGHQAVHGKGTGQIGPLASQFVPTEMLTKCGNCYGDDERREPPGIEKTLETVPIPVYDIAGKEEMAEDDGLTETGPLQPVLLLVVKP